MQSEGSHVASLSDNAPDSNPIAGRTSRDDYYSNEDIALLHTVVVAAQELLEEDEERLPVSALFKPYDAVLEQNGYDPDDDQHFSAFLFKVSGEPGHGTLVDKFLAILSRMGIVLEFGETTTASLHTSPPTSPAFSSSRRIQRTHQRQISDGSNHSRDHAAPESSLQSSTSTREMSDDEEEPVTTTTHEDPEARLAASRASLLSYLNRWKHVAKQDDQQSRLPRPAVSVIEEATEPVSDDPVYEGQKRANGEGLKPASQDDGDKYLENEADYQHRPPSRASHLNATIDRWRNATISAGNGPASTVVLDGGSPQVLHVPSQPTPRAPTGPDNHESGLRGQYAQINAPAVGVSWLDEEDFADNQKQQQKSPPSKQPVPVPEPELEPEREREQERERDKQQQQQQQEHQQHEKREQHVQEEQQQPDQQRQALPSPQEPQQKRTEANSGQQQSGHRPLTVFHTEDNTAALARYERLLKRAARARELYLASKFFNYWADRTARRLERDAVARRHMIRFRCFRGWSQAPATRTPPADQMRISVSVKKWQRNIAMQNSTLQASADATEQRFQATKVRRALEQWRCHRSGNAIRKAIALRLQRKAVANWTCHVLANDAPCEAARFHAEFRRGVNGLNAWLSHTQVDGVKSAVAQQIGVAQRSLRHMREWWDQTGIETRAKSYWQSLLLKKALSILEVWNLRAMAQAVVWQRESLAGNRALQNWIATTCRDQDLRERGKQLYADQAWSRSLKALRHRQVTETDLSLLGNRAYLYIGATRLLSVFDTAVENRSYREKQQVKRYLMARYTQMSSLRKRRSFFKALDHWGELTVKEYHDTKIAGKHIQGRHFRQRSLVLEKWVGKAVESEQQQQAAWLHQCQELLENWVNHARDADQRQDDAWHLWAVGKQRFLVREWYKISLQQSGHAHTASKVREMYGRERRNRCFQRWRLGNEDTLDPETQRQAGLGMHPQGSLRKTLRTISARRSTTMRNDEQDFASGPMETPTRWTGQPLPMSTLASSRMMDPVREDDEDDARSSDENDMSPGGLRDSNNFLAQSTTTPKAPIPFYMNRALHPQRSEFKPASSRRTVVTAAEPGPLRLSGEAASLFGRTAGSTPALSKVKQHGLQDRSSEAPTALANTSTPAPWPHPQPTASRSVGAQPSSMRHESMKALRNTLATRSVRIRSPDASPNTPQRPKEVVGAKPWRSAISKA